MRRRMRFPRQRKHVGETGGIGAGVADGGVCARLVDHQHIAGRQRRQRPTVLAALPNVPAELTVPVIAPIVLLHWTNGASVT